jgi:AcrR family transcriptional regulator
VAAAVFNERGYDGTSMRDLAQRLGYLVRGSVEVLEAELPYVTLLLRVRGNTRVERAALNQRRAFDQFVAGLVREAQREGDIRPDCDALLTARLLFGLVNSIAEWYRPTRRATSRPLADLVCAMAFDGLRVRRG